MAASVAIQVASAAWNNRRHLWWLLALLFLLPLVVVAMFSAVMLMPGSSGVGKFAPSTFALSDIPADYLRVYQSAGATVDGGWEYLAAIGKIETNHGRSTAPGVKSGVNAFGCCAGPMQFMITGVNSGTWGAYGVDGNHDGKKSPYDPEDAIPAAADYLKASGAPEDWDRAIFSYNHASWYVDQVKELAARYRGQAIGMGGLPAGSSISQGVLPGRWLIPVPGTSAVCDARIVPDLLMLIRRYKMALGDCYAASGHAMDGEHPLGLGVDIVPGDGGSWPMLGQLAHDLGWRSSCAVNGCAGSLPSPFRFIGWNGYKGHGDPDHVGGNAHLHLSWQHSPASPNSQAARVQTLLGPSGSPR